MSWDWRGQPDLDELDRIVANLSEGLVFKPIGAMVRVLKVETGCDEYGIVVTDEVLDQAQVDERWRAWWRSDR